MFTVLKLSLLRSERRDNMLFKKQSPTIEHLVQCMRRVVMPHPVQLLNVQFLLTIMAKAVQVDFQLILVQQLVAR